jgi:hypothetical protein
VGWNLENPAKQAAIRLFWYTEGRGTQDVGIAEELELPAGRATCTGTFRFTLPDAPYSFQGSLITLKWAIELVLNKGRDVERLDLIVSPWVEQVRLNKVG